MALFCQLQLGRLFFWTFYVTLNKKFHILNLYLIYVMNTIFKNINGCHEAVENQIFKKVYLPLKTTWRSCLFFSHLHDPKPKQNHQISSSRGKTRSTQSQTSVTYRGNIICIKRNTDVFVQHSFCNSFRHGLIEQNYFRLFHRIILTNKYHLAVTAFWYSLQATTARWYLLVYFIWRK